MAAGSWSLNGSTIVVDHLGRIIDGQHRLTACVQSGAGFGTVVVSGVSSERAFATLGIGKRRSGADTLAVLGATQAKTMAAAVALVVRYETSASEGEKNLPSATISISNQVLADHWENHAAEYTAWSDRIKRMRGALLGEAAGTAFCVLASRRQGIDLVADFIDRVIDGVGLAAGDPRLALRQGLINMANTRPKPEEQLALVIRAYVPWLTGEPRSHIKKWNRNQVFPRLGDPT
jgi:hypothetical protein